MSYEFKRLSDVEVVEKPATAANVLIEENGVIKKAPKSAVGGGEWDLVIVDDYYDDVNSQTIESGSYQNVYNKIMVDKEEPKILIKYRHQYGDYCYGVRSFHKIADIMVYSEDSTQHYLYIVYDAAKYEYRGLYVTQNNEVLTSEPTFA